MANITWDDDISSDVNEADVQWDKKQWGGMPQHPDWESMPETGYIEGAKTGIQQPSPKYTAEDPDTGRRTTGYKFFNQFVPESDHAALPPRQQPQNSLMSSLGQFSQGTKEGVAGLLGLPVDVANTVLGLPFGRTTGLSNNPVGGSQSIMNAFAKMGLPQEQTPQTFIENVARAAGQQTPGLVVPAGMATKAGTSAMGAVGTAIPSTLASAVSSGTARTLAPDQPLVDMLATMTGGATTALVQSAARNWLNPSINSRISKTLNGVAPLSRTDLGGTGGKNMLDAQAKSVDGVKLITVSNKTEPFKYTDISGRTVSTGLPKSRLDFSQAIDQMKTRVYKSFNDMQSAAGQKGLTFSGDDLNTRFNRFMENPEAPPSISDVANYMKRQMRKYEGQEFTPQQIESEIAHLNAKLRAYNKNPSPSLTSHATADEQILRILRDELDSGITRFEGPGYAAFKNQYGSIKALQDRVGKASLAQLKEEGTPKKWYDLSDIGVGVGSIAAATHSPQYALVGGSVIAAKKAAQYLMQPDRRITRMFDAANKVVKPVRWEMGTSERPMPQSEGPAQLPRGRTGQPPIEAEWTPVNRTGSVAARRPAQPTVQEAASFDFDATLDSMIKSGAYGSPAEARNILLQNIRENLKRRR